jgi:uncharacterized repeat protein (TIGR02543 family)
MVALKVMASVLDGGTLSYQGYVNGVDSNVDGTPIAGATSDSFVVPTKTAGTKYYYCEVVNTNSLGIAAPPKKSEAVSVTCVATVIFNSNGGKLVASKVVAGGTITEPKKPTKTGYTFSGWYRDKRLRTTWNFRRDSVTGNVTLYARWKAKTINLTFQANGGKVQKKKTATIKNTFDKKIKMAKNPVRKNHTFDGWYTRKKGGKKITQTTKVPSKNTTYYARWIKK